MLLLALSCHSGPGIPFPTASVRLDPPNGRQGTDQMVTVRGTYTDFTGGPCAASFAGGQAEVTEASVAGADRIGLRISIPAGAPEGPATLTLETADGTFEPEFTILPASSDASVRFEPSAVPAGFQGEIVVVGTGTSFEPGITSLSFEEASGIPVRRLQVDGPTRLRVEIDVPATTRERDYAASVSTRSQVLGTQLRVLAGEAPGLILEPDRAPQGSTDFPIEIHGRNFTLEDTCDVAFLYDPPGVVLHDVLLVRDDPEYPGEAYFTALLNIAADATWGNVTLQVVCGDLPAFGSFFIQRVGDAPSCRFEPATVHAGDRSVALHVIGHDTSFRRRGTTAESSQPWFVVESVDVDPPPYNALLVASVDADAPVAPVAVTFVTLPDERVTCYLTVLPAPAATLTFEPDVLEHPVDADEDVELTIRVTGIDLTSCDPLPELVSEAGSGIAVRPGSLVVTGPGEATVAVRISRDAPFGRSSLTLTACSTTLSADVLVTRAAGDAPYLDPDYLLLDGTAHDLTFVSTNPPFRAVADPWPVLARAGVAGLDVAGPLDGITLDGTEYPLSATPSLGLPAAHYTIAAHGRDPDAFEHRGRHLAARLTGIALPGVYGTATPSTLSPGRTWLVVVTASAPAFDETTVAVPLLTSGIDRASRYVSPTLVHLTLTVDQLTPPGDHVIVLYTAGSTVPVVVNVSAPGEPPTFRSNVPLAAGTIRGEVSLSGRYTAWSSATEPDFTFVDPDLAIVRSWIDPSTSTRFYLQVNVPATPEHIGGHIVWLRTGAAVTPGLLWIGAPARGWTVFPGWLHEGREEVLTLSGSDLSGLRAVVNPDAGIGTLDVVERAADHVVVSVQAVEPAGGHALLAIDPDGSGTFATLVIPVLPAPPEALPAARLVPREPRAQTLTAALHGLDSATGVSARPVGPGIRFGRPTVLPGGDIAVDAVMDLDASADENRWLVLLGDSGAAAVRLLPGGVRPESLALGVSDVESAAPGFPALYSLTPGASGLAAIRADCDRPLATTVSLVAADGMTVVARSKAGAPLPFTVPGPGIDGGAAFLAIESTAPTTCTAYHIPWLEFDRAVDLELDDDPETILLDSSPAYRHLARLDAGYDIDRFRIQLTRPARIEVATGQPQDFAARAEFVLEVTDPEGTVWTADPWDAGADGIASLAFDPSGADDTYDIAVRAIAGSHGPYVLSIHEQVLIDEVDLWSGGIRFVELAGPPGLSLDDWLLVHRSVTGDEIARTALSVVIAEDGSFVVAADLAALPDAEVEWAALDAVAPPATLALLDGTGRQVDAVGFGGATGEGGSVVPPETPTSLGRCLRVDSNDNATDFWRQHGPTPHAANECEFER